MTLSIRGATETDIPLLARMNKHLIEDEGSRNPMSVPELEQRLRGWLDSGWKADLFVNGDAVVGYALYQERGDEYDATRRVIYARQFFVERSRRRRRLGAEAFSVLRRTRFPGRCKVVLDVLSANTGALRFWEHLGFLQHVVVLELPPD